ncbi:MAG: hypothetical protein JST16_07000 [Bdellovibrionales bacterium]|nr:hypothetical protein [Bdellovibrionales bacterium]
MKSNWLLLLLPVTGPVLAETPRVFDGSVSAAHQQQILATLDYLQHFDADRAQWFSERIRYFIDESRPISTQDLIEIRSGIPLPHADEEPINHAAKLLQEATDELTADFHEGVLAKNLGASLYSQSTRKGATFNGTGERVGTMYGLKIAGQLVPLRGPRVGIVQIGNYLLEDSPTATLGSEARKIWVLATLLHEARHSDGHGANRGFEHLMCPGDHELAFTYACDNAPQSPYMVAADFLRLAIPQCATCSAADLESLKLRYADAVSRRVEIKVLSTSLTLESLRTKLAGQNAKISQKLVLSTDTLVRHKLEFYQRLFNHFDALATAYLNDPYFDHTVLNEEPEELPQ